MHCNEYAIHCLFSRNYIIYNVAKLLVRFRFFLPTSGIHFPNAVLDHHHDDAAAWPIAR